jgi:carbon-monoxide dehydrogenase medium subunit
MRDFAYLEPRTVTEASRMLADHGETARLLAGGTFLVLVMRQRLLSPSHLVDLTGVPALRDIAVDERNGLTLGALVTHAEIERHPAIRAAFPVVAEMARRVANPQIRNAGTIGGNLCYGDPASDPPACFLALGAEVRATRATGERVIPLDEFFTDYFETALAPDEVLTAIRLPRLPRGAHAAYARFTATAAESRPLVSVGVMVSRDGGGVCQDVRLALGAVTPVPRRLGMVESFLRGRSLTPETVAEAARMAAAAVEPPSDFRGSAGYKKRIAGVMVRRTLERALASPAG